MSGLTEEPFYNDNSSYVYEDTVARLQDLTMNVLNISLENVISMLSDWQKDELMEIDSESGVECLLRMWFTYKMDDVNTETTYCNATWDKKYCLPPASVGAVVTQRCSGIVEGEITKACLENGTWSGGDVCTKYSDGISSFFEPNGYLSVVIGHMMFTGSILSLISLAGSLLTFASLRSIWNQRLTLQVHFMLALFLRFVILLVVTEPFISNRNNTYRNDNIFCKFLVAAYLYSCMATVMWMLIQGIYLNGKLTTNVLRDETKNKIRFYYVLGWVFPGVVLVGYLATMIGNLHDEVCWKGYSDMIEIWIILVPILGALAINAIILLNILRVIICKSRCFQSGSETSKLISIAKATGILFPVLGVNNMLLIYNPGGEYEKYFRLINAFFGSTQGVLVAVVYCLMSKDVQRAIRRSYNRFLARRGFRGRTRINQQESFLLRNMPMFSREQTEQSLKTLETSQV